MGAGLSIVDVLKRHSYFLGPKSAVSAGGDALSFRQLWSEAGDLSAQLEARGARGHIVALAADPSPAFVVMLLATMMAGAAAAPINTKLTVVELDAYLDNVRPSMGVLGQHDGFVLAATDLPCAVAKRTGGSWQLANGDHNGRPPWAPTSVSGQDLALVIGTGGTTGLPKGAAFDHAALWMWAVAAAFAQQLREADVELFSAPFFHSTLLTGLFSPLFAGASVHIVERFEAETVEEAVTEHGANRIGGPPTALRRIIERAVADPETWRAVRTVQFGTTRAPRGFVHDLRMALPDALPITGYGTTECGPVTRAFGDDISAEDESQVGRPVPAASITVGGSEDPGARSRTGKVGEIAISCPWQMAGYVEAGALVRVERIDPGDLGFVDDHGRLHIAGRTKDVVITGGQNVYPHEVERAFEVHPTLAEVAVYGADDGSWGERVELACVVNPRHEVPTLDELREFGHRRLARYKLPRRLVVLEALPMTANMKVDRLRLSRGAVDVLASAELEDR